MKEKTCPRCGGMGIEDGCIGEGLCPLCLGKGKVSIIKNLIKKGKE